MELTQARLLGWVCDLGMTLKRIIRHLEFILSQWFSTGSFGNVCRHFWLSPFGGECYWSLWWDQEAAKHLATHREAPHHTAKDYQVPNVERAKAENLLEGEGEAMGGLSREAMWPESGFLQSSGLVVTDCGYCNLEKTLEIWRACDLETGIWKLAEVKGRGLGVSCDTHCVGPETEPLGFPPLEVKS